jgi:hypothetical protein
MRLCLDRPQAASHASAYRRMRPMGRGNASDRRYRYHPCTVEIRIPRTLTKKRNQLAYERAQLQARSTDVETELSALDYALKTIDPTWRPPKKVTGPRRPPTLPAGGVAKV